MRAPIAPPEDAGTTSIGQPGVVIFLVLLLGAVVYLHRAHYLRRKTGYITMAILVALLAYVGWELYRTSA